MPSVLGIKVATLDSVMTFQDLAALIDARAPGQGPDHRGGPIPGLQPDVRRQAALIGMGAACTTLQRELMGSYREARFDRFVELNRLVDDLARHTFKAPMEGYIQRMLWCLVHQGVIPEDAAHDPWGPRLDRAEFDDLMANASERIEPEECGGPAHERLPTPLADRRTRCSRGAGPQGRRGPRPVRPHGPPRDLELTCGRLIDLDMTASYAGMTLRNPWGKASGQLSLNLAQLEEAAAEGLGFVVLKTVIAQDAAGQQTMGAWAIKESRMVAEPITSPLTGRTRLDGHLEGQGMVAVVRRLPHARS